MAAILRISDGTTTISLLNGDDGFFLNNWTPALARNKGGGVFQSSPLSDGRRLVSRMLDNTIEAFDLKVRGEDADDAITLMQNLRRLLEKAINYWVTDWQNEPVWIEAQANCETNLRYALIYSYSTPNDDNPYSQPFLQGQGVAVLDDWLLSIEHGHWLADQPGTGTCVQISGTQTFCYPNYLEFDGDDSEVNCGNDASLTDLADDAFTIEAWVRANSLGEGDDGTIASKTPDNAGSEGWVLTVTGGIVAAVTTNAESVPLAGDLGLTTDNDWHHVAMTFDDAGDRKIDLFVDGTEVTYAVQDAAVGAIIADNLRDFHIGNNDDGDNGFDGDIGWVRVSDSVRYAATFTPPARCVIPGPDANTLAIWIREGTGTAIDNAEGTAARDGTAADTSWECDCSTTYGRAATCNDEVYIANKQNLAQLTHIFVDDGGTFGANLVNETAYNLLPAVPANGDAVYFGIDSGALDGGPFSSLVFDIGVAQNDLDSLVYEYWNGAWNTLTEQDNTADFATTGVNSVHWNQPSDWTTTAVNGTTAYWVRARVAVIGAAPSTPTQQNRSVYTITWPYIGIDSVQVNGDIVAIAKTILTNQSGDVTAGLGTELQFTRAIVGLRSLSRGSSFTAFLNASDEQNDSNITVSAGTDCAFATDVTAPTGRIARLSPTGTSSNFINRVTYTIGTAISSQFYGSFHCFVRCDQNSGSLGDIALTVATQVGSGGYTTESAIGNIVSLSDFQLIDMGKIEIATTDIDSDESAQVSLQIRARVTSLTPTFDFYDLILIPVDEWAADLFNVSDSLSTVVVNGRTLNIDSVDFPKSNIRAIVKDTSDNIATVYVPVSNGPEHTLQSNASQRLWFLFTSNDVSGGVLQDDFQALPDISSSVQITHNARYLSMRGLR